MITDSSQFLFYKVRCDSSYYSKLLVVGLLLGSFAAAIGDHVVYAFGSTGKVWLFIVDFLVVLRCSFSVLVLALRV
jgi:hypothetical protein